MLREACDRHGVLLIADEIAVGFGRTGHALRLRAGRHPPGLPVPVEGTHRRLPAALGRRRRPSPSTSAFYDDYTKLTAFLHSHSYTGNPIACAAALATLGIFRDEDVIAQNRALARRIGEALAPLADHPHVAEVRQTGMIAAIEFVKDRASGERYDWRERRGLRAYRHALAAGALLRPIGNVVYLMPPYVIDAGRDRLARGRRARRRGCGMRLIRVHVDSALAPGARVALAGAAAAHLRRVLRLEAGDAVTLFNGDGAGLSVADRGLRPRHRGGRSRTDRVAARAESPLAITLVQGIARAERMDLVVQKATELGVAAIVPVATARSVVRLDAATRARKSRALAGHRHRRLRAMRPRAGPRRRRTARVRRFLAASAARHGARLLLSPDARRSRSRPWRRARQSMRCWSVRKAGSRKRSGAPRSTAGYRACRLGPRVLRSETAAIAAIAVLQSVAGDLG